MQEGPHTEFKGDVSERIARAAVAFSNTEGGTIFVGINDKGEVIGVADTDQTSIRCAQILKDNVRPDITLTSRISQTKIEGLDIVKIDVSEGPDKPYYLRDKGLRAEGVFIRRGTTNLPASEETFRAMVQKPRSRLFENMISFRQDLTFKFTESVFSENGLEFGPKQMESLKMMKGGQYTNLGFMLSDQFDAQVKAALFQDEYKDLFLDRVEIDGSILEQFEKVMTFINGHNTKRSVIVGTKREDTLAYPVVAVREAILNALVHRDYSMNGTILVSMYPDKMTISSPGGLNESYDLEDLKTGISSTRNPGLANILYRLGYIEAYGTGIPRMMRQYLNRGEPTFKISNAVFFVTLPSLLSEVDGLEALLRAKEFITRSDLEGIGYPRASALREINLLEEEGVVEKVGGGRSTRYRVL